MSEAGEAFEAAETEQWDAQEAMYFGKRSAPVSGEAEKKRAKKAEKEPRLASLDIANAWQNMLMAPSNVWWYPEIRESNFRDCGAHYPPSTESLLPKPAAPHDNTNAEYSAFSVSGANPIF